MFSVFELLYLKFDSLNPEFYKSVMLLLQAISKIFKYNRNWHFKQRESIFEMAFSNQCIIEVYSGRTNQ
ncbi:hypothetical protein LEP1GSC172_2547 [Leptospira noguchii]|uniref:Uncharacterized protein n=1 Tax=Leptospira noguchii TaxID=28182 RepID=M6V2W5_9LEPT|nr:hypothetical protein LEP1GSC172_2547 [Leptospira noguchii]